MPKQIRHESRLHLTHVWVAVLLLAAMGCNGSSATSPATTTTGTTTTTSTATVSSLAITGTTALGAGTPTSQLVVTATLSDATTPVVTSASTWVSSNTAVATVTAGGLVSGISIGSATITATYQGQTATALITVSNLSVSTTPCPSGINPHGTMTAKINGVAWTAGCVTVAEFTAGTGVLHISGTDNFSLIGQNIDIQLSSPGVGTFSDGPGVAPFLAQLLVGGSGNTSWSTGSGSGTLTVDALSPVGASGSFSLSLSPSSAIANGTKTITNGVFNVTF